MTIDTSKSETTPYHSLLDYFSRPRADALEPIAHPDSSINKMVDSRHNALRKAAVLIPITRLDSDNDSHIVLMQPPSERAKKK